MDDNLTGSGVAQRLARSGLPSWRVLRQAANQMSWMASTSVPGLTQFAFPDGSVLVSMGWGKRVFAGDLTVLEGREAYIEDMLAWGIGEWCIDEYVGGVRCDETQIGALTRHGWLAPAARVHALPN